jgi:hypothetical protein
MKISNEDIEQMKLSVKQIGEETNNLIIRNIRKLRFQEALSIVQNQVELLLPDFEEQSPKISWVRQWFDKTQGIVILNPQPFNFYGENTIDESFEGFIEALGLIDSAITDFDLGNTDNAWNMLCNALKLLVATRQLRFRILYYPLSWQIHIQTRESEPTTEEFDVIREYRDSVERRKFYEQNWLDVIEDIQDIMRNSNDERN